MKLITGGGKKSKSVLGSTRESTDKDILCIRIKSIGRPFKHVQVYSYST
jgi:hypothetical protein